MNIVTKQESMASLNPSHKPYITINKEAARNIGNYVRVGRVDSPADMSGTVATIMKHCMDIQLTAESLEVVNLSTCILIKRVLVSVR